MAVPPRPRATPAQEQEDDDGDDDEFTFPTPPPQLLGKQGFHLPLCSASASASSSPPVWLLSSSPIRRSFSAADCAASPWRDRVLLARQRQRQRRDFLNGGCSPALSDYGGGGGFCDGGEEEEEERMDSLWEDMNNYDAASRGEDLLFATGRSLDVSRRRSVAGARPDTAERARSRVGKDEDQHGGAALAESRSSRRRPPGLVVMMRALRRMFVAHKGNKSRVHRDEQSTASASASASASSFSFSLQQSRKG